MNTSIKESLLMKLKPRVNYHFSLREAINTFVNFLGV